MWTGAIWTMPAAMALIWHVYSPTAFPKPGPAYLWPLRAIDALLFLDVLLVGVYCSWFKNHRLYFALSAGVAVPQIIVTAQIWFFGRRYLEGIWF
jgi:hypothetical protein